MNNVLISREWLENAFDNLCCHNCKICRNFRIEDSFYKCALIDNAPTVATPYAIVKFDKDDLKRICDERIIEPIKNGELVIQTEERPTGHWEAVGFVNMKYAWCRCSNCHKTTKIYKDSSNDFCCIADIRKKVIACLYCGADMRKEKEE